MGTIGLFTHNEDDSFTGFVRTLGFSSEVRFVPVKKQDGPFSPSHRMYAGEIEIGSALALAPVQGMRHLRVDMKPPGYPARIVALLVSSEGSDFDLLWHRPGAGKLNKAA
jgi:uncharacterized protein (DUF736 family)